MKEYSEKPKKGIGRKILTTLSIVVVLAAAAFVFFKFFFVFGTGVKAGELNLFVYKGYVFKTYEGRLIQTGYNSKNSNNTIQSNEFNFSVKDEKVAKQLERCTGKVVELHYKEYLGTLPWRGMTKYVVDSVYSVSPSVGQTGAPLLLPGEVL
jgi:flagellar basal body-associated protein FliL